MQIASVLTIVIGIQLLVTHAIATTLYLYWAVWWMDIMMHLLGGVWLVCAWRSLIDMKVISQKWWSMKIALPILIGVMVVWEIFGVYVEQGFKPGYVADTVGDMVCGILGTLIGFWLLRRLQILNNFSEN
ncbi:MAG: hypothetical protein ACK42D_00665 [Candidatus Paceibacteria bacterium]